MMTFAAELELISAAAHEAARIALDYRARGLTVRSKPGGSPVTDGDLAVDAFLKAELMRARPGYGWLSEETPDTIERLRARRVFIVDPIDGTTAYISDQPWFVIAVAVVEAGRPVAGVIHAPVLDEHYTAIAGGGATLNGNPIRASDTDMLEGSAMAGDPRLFRSPRWPQPWPEDMQVAQRNALAYRMAAVAAGAFDAAVSLGWKNDWDVAAGDLIAREAGARSTDPLGRPLVFNSPRARNPGLVCAAPRLHPLILARTAPIDLPADA
ncbi:MAG: 3'(2'),5'-bisphosphate nucleotidase CysQ [Caulobacteraceae bacterium]